MGVALNATVAYFSDTLKTDILTEDKSKEPIGTLAALVNAKLPLILVEPLISRAYRVFAFLLIPTDLEPPPSWTFPFSETSFVEPDCK